MESTQDTLNPEEINWESNENYILLNPRFLFEDLESLVEIARETSKIRNLQGHIWLATSGSTAESNSQIKLVALSKAAFLNSAISVNKHLQVTATDKWLQALPQFHVGGLGIQARSTLSRSHVVRNTEKWDPQRVFNLMNEQRVTLASMVPTQVLDCVKAQLKAPKYLRAVIVGGGALSENLYFQAKKLGWPLLPSYGMTETCSQIATATLESLCDEQLPLAKKLTHIEWHKNSEGLLQVKGNSLLSLYVQRQKDGSFRDWDPKVDSWFTTEDVAELQGAYIRIIGRIGDFIKIGGEASSMGRLRNIFARAVSVVDSSTPSHFYLVDAPSERLGTEIHLITTLSDDNSLSSQIREIYDKEVLPFERIREIRYIREVPRSDLGKILWEKLKKELYVY